MAQSRRRSPLEEDFDILCGEDESSSGDVCERCGCQRHRHDEHIGCACGRCAEFQE